MTTGNDGKVRFATIPFGTLKFKEIAAQEGYILDSTEHTVVVSKIGDSISVVIDGKTGTDTNKITIENVKKEIPPGNLAIDKTVTGNGGDLTKSFRFTINIGNDRNQVYNYEGSKTGTLRSGDVLELAHGERIVIKNIPNGTTYNVVEDNYTSDGYTTTFTNANGEIESNTTKQANFYNHKEITPSVTTPTTLQIGKIITGSGANANDEFGFEIEFGNGNPAEEYDYYKDGVYLGKIKTGDTFKLKAGQNLIVRNVPEGIGYTVREVNYLDYTPETTVITGTIIVHPGINYALFKNDKQAAPTYGNLAINKTVTGNGGDLTR